MDKPKHNISNWQLYKQGLVNRCSLIVWMDDATHPWYCQFHHGRRDQGF